MEYPAIKWLRRVDTSTNTQWNNGVSNNNGVQRHGGLEMMDNLISVDGNEQYQLIQDSQILDLGGKFIIYSLFQVVWGCFKKIKIKHFKVDSKDLF